MNFDLKCANFRLKIVILALEIAEFWPFLINNVVDFYKNNVL